jgi:hypothetical protein
MMPPNILNLRSYRVTGLEEDEYHCHVQAQVAEAPQKCIYCAQTIRGFGRLEQLVKDLPILKFHNGWALMKFISLNLAV